MIFFCLGASCVCKHETWTAKPPTTIFPRCCVRAIFQSQHILAPGSIHLCVCSRTTNLNVHIRAIQITIYPAALHSHRRILSRGFHFAIHAPRFSVDEHRTHPYKSTHTRTPTGLISHHRPQNFISRGGIINSEPPPLFHTQRFRMENWCRRARPRVFSLGADMCWWLRARRRKNNNNSGVHSHTPREYNPTAPSAR